MPRDLENDRKHQQTTFINCVEANKGCYNNNGIAEVNDEWRQNLRVIFFHKLMIKCPGGSKCLQSVFSFWKMLCSSFLASTWVWLEFCLQNLAKLRTVAESKHVVHHFSCAHLRFNFSQDDYAANTFHPNLIFYVLGLRDPDIGYVTTDMDNA